MRLQYRGDFIWQKSRKIRKEEDLFSCLQYGTKIRLDGIDCEVRVCPNSGKALVYDSEEEEEGPSDENLTTDKKKVLKFFNEGTEQELTGIQVPVPYRTD